MSIYKKYNEEWDYFNERLYEKFKRIQLLRSTGFFLNSTIIHKDPEKKVDIDELIQEINQKDLILHNDDINTFQHVADCLMKYCSHHPLQAEQCVIIVHNKGKCGVKVGTYEELEPICTALLDNGLSATIK